MTLFTHPLWPTLLPYLFIDSTGTRVNGPRHRIEVGDGVPLAVFEIQTPCANPRCGQLIYNVRRTQRGRITLNLSCPLAVNYACARVPATRHLADRVRDAMAGTRPRAFDFGEL
jgi:hypothetical protein